MPIVDNEVQVITNHNFFLSNVSFGEWVTHDADEHVEKRDEEDKASKDENEIKQIAVRLYEISFANAEWVMVSFTKNQHPHI